MTVTQFIDPADRAAYLKAQKSRNLYIGLALFGFVALVFLVSIVRMGEGIARDKEHRAAEAARLSNVAPSSAAKP